MFCLFLVDGTPVTVKEFEAHANQDLCPLPPDCGWERWDRGKVRWRGWFVPSESLALHTVLRLADGSDVEVWKVELRTGGQKHRYHFTSR